MEKLTAEEIKQDLLDQLDRNGTTGNYYLDLVDDYMDLWETKKQLQADIEKKGVSMKYQNGANQWGYKKNDSVDQQLKVNAQQIKILQYLKIQPSEIEKEFDTDDWSKIPDM